MKKKNVLKQATALTLALGLSISTAMISFAGEWKQDDIGRWYVNDDGGYTTKDWQIIDNVAYFFGSTGYMIGSTSDWVELEDDGSYIFEIDRGIGKDYGVKMFLPDISTGYSFDEMQSLTLEVLIYQWREKIITTREEVADYISTSGLSILTSEEQNELVNIITLIY